MRVETLDVLRCPYCGGSLSLVDNAALAQTTTHVESGVLACECCAYPIVAGIPVMIAGDAVRTATHQLESGDRTAALFTLLGWHDGGDRAEAFRALLDLSAEARSAKVERDRPATYREVMTILRGDAEGEYFVYRFSDPTFLTASGVLDVLTRGEARTGLALDLCGGSGHLTRVLAGLTSPDRAMLADIEFSKLWAARRFIVPGCDAVCCNANHPLPFTRRSFSLVLCADAFSYIFQKRLLAEEMMRLADDDGVVMMPHVHSSLGENFSAGMTLTPRGYLDLFEPLAPRVFRESTLLTQVLEHQPLDLSSDASPDALEGEPSLTLIATRREEIFRAYEPRAAYTDVAGELRVNPLYRVEHRNGTSVLTLTFPTPEYAAEFGECRRYLPETVTVPANLAAPFDAPALGAHYDELRRRHVIIDVPKHYV